MYLYENFGCLKMKIEKGQDNRSSAKKKYIKKQYDRKKRNKEKLQIW